MTPSTNQDQEYQQAQKAYIQGNYEEAATLVDRLVQNFPDDPSSHLLRGHIYCVLQQYDLAREHYQMVLSLTEDPEFIDCANNGLESVSQYQSSDQSASGAAYNPYAEQPDVEDLGTLDDFDFNSFNGNSFQHPEAPGSEFEEPFGISFGASSDVNAASSGAGESLDAFADPFALNQPHDDQDLDSNRYEQWEDYLGYSSDSSLEEAEFRPLHGSDQWLPSDASSSQDLTLLMPGAAFKETSETENNFGNNTAEQFPQIGSGKAGFDFEETDDQTLFLAPDLNEFHSKDSVDLNTFNAAFGSDATAANALEENTNKTEAAEPNNINFLDEIDEFDDLGDSLQFNLPSSEGETTSSWGANAIPLSLSESESSDENSGFLREHGKSDSEHGVFSVPGSEEAVPAFTQADSSNSAAEIAEDRSWLARFENASLERKQWLTAGTVGIVSAVVVAVVSFGGSLLSPTQESRAAVRNTGWAIAAAAGIAGFATTRLVGQLTVKHIKRTTVDLKSQFDAMREGNLNAQATVYSKDEFGLLASEFNEMSRVIFTTTSEAQRRAEEQEQAKEELQRQVIRLLDDVEGAARGDLTVRAEVSADVLGAVADSFNLTIQNLREIVQQVKLAARQVSKGATDSETFAQALSSDALRQAEELAVALNSVQVMTDAIQRVAESAREAESVARSASSSAQKGGEAVERTVAGILEIRQTVAQTTRKVKRLAESSQEISKIVALISQIASRTNLLALNASIEAARAGEAGRGFAIVADEVRQLANRVAKALKEIEQIVKQIQSETGSVMTAMEEGTQQVIQGTHLAEQAKRSLEDIVQVSNRIDTLVRSITADTVQQTATSREVAHVMQSVESTAQTNSQEAQRVSGSLQNLVGVAGSLLTSVERFRVETTESR